MRVRRLLGDRRSDRGVPQVEKVRGRPSLERIATTVAAHFGCELGDWSSGRRSDAIGRAVAAYLARQRFGYSMVDIAEILGYRGHSSVCTALIRVEAAGTNVQKSLEALERQLANA
jgi:chromosomal replication initiation ATPase DnaA